MLLKPGKQQRWDRESIRVFAIFVDTDDWVGQWVLRYARNITRNQNTQQKASLPENSYYSTHTSIVLANNNNNNTHTR